MRNAVINGLRGKKTPKDIISVLCAVHFLNPIIFLRRRQVVTELSKVYDLDPEPQTSTGEIEGRTRMDKTSYAIYARQHNNKDAWILVTGDLGDGKSTLSIELLRKITKLNGFKWSLKKNILFNPDYNEINSTIHNIDKSSTIVVDEAAKVLHARNWNQSDQIQFSIMSDRVRFRNLCIIFNIRMMKEVDLLFRTGRFFYWVDIIKRGIAAVFARDAAYSLRSKGDAYNSEILMEKVEELDINDISSRMAAYETMPNFRGFIYFPPLNSRIDNAYQSMKEASDNKQYQQSKEVEMSRQQKEAVLTNLIVNLFEKGTSLKEISEVINQGNPEKPITEYKIKRIISKARRSADKVADKELVNEVK